MIVSCQPWCLIHSFENWSSLDTSTKIAEVSCSLMSMLESFSPRCADPVLYVAVRAACLCVLCYRRPVGAGWVIRYWGRLFIYFLIINSNSTRHSTCCNSYHCLALNYLSLFQINNWVSALTPVFMLSGLVMTNWGLVWILLKFVTLHIRV